MSDIKKYYFYCQSFCFLFFSSYAHHLQAICYFGIKFRFHGFNSIVETVIYFSTYFYLAQIIIQFILIWFNGFYFYFQSIIYWYHFLGSKARFHNAWLCYTCSLYCILINSSPNISRNTKGPFGYNLFLLKTENIIVK